MTATDLPGQERYVMRLAEEIASVGREISLPYIAVSADIADPRPVVDPNGVPLAETMFQWVNPKLEYWKDSSFALKSDLIKLVRLTAEPFFLEKGYPRSWRVNPLIESVSLAEPCAIHDVSSAIVSPCHLPHGVIGSIVWANSHLIEDLEEIFHKYAARLHILTLKFVAAYNDLHVQAIGDLGEALTRREIQCLKWAAAGKTDAEIAIIVGISQPTVRFHLNNAARKFGVNGRGQMIHRATRLGYVGHSLP